MGQPPSPAPIAYDQILSELGYINANLVAPVPQQDGSIVLTIRRENGQTDRAVVRKTTDGTSFILLDGPTYQSDDQQMPKGTDRSVAGSAAAQSGARTVQTGKAGDLGTGNIWADQGSEVYGRGPNPQPRTLPPQQGAPGAPPMPGTPGAPPAAPTPAPAAPAAPAGPPAAGVPSGAAGSNPAMYVGMESYLQSLKRQGWEPIGRGKELSNVYDEASGKSVQQETGNTILTIRSPDGKTTEFYTVKVTPNPDGTESFGTVKAAAGTLTGAQDAGGNRQVVSTSDGSIFLVDKGDAANGVPPTVTTMRDGAKEKTPKVGDPSKFIKITDDQGRTTSIVDPESGTSWAMTPSATQGKPGTTRTTIVGDRKITEVADADGNFQIGAVTGLAPTPQEQAQINLQAAQASLASAQAGVVEGRAGAQNSLDAANAALANAQAGVVASNAQSGQELQGAQAEAQRAAAKASEAATEKAKQDLNAPVELTANTTAAFRSWRDPKTNEVHYDINPNFQPQTLADVQTVTNQVQARLRDKRAELAGKISRDYTQEQALDDYNKWYDAQIRPMEAQLTNWQSQAQRAQNLKDEEQARNNLTTAGTVGQYAVQAAQEERKNTVGPGYGAAFGALMKSFQSNTPLAQQGPIDWASAATYQAPTLDSIYEQAVAKYLQHISPTAAGITQGQGATPTLVQQQRQAQSAGPTQQAQLFDPNSGLGGAPGTTPGTPGAAPNPFGTIAEQLDRTKYSPVQPINININSGQPAGPARLPLAV